MNANTVIFVHAMSRAGQHPIIDWIYEQFNNNKLFLNYYKISLNNPDFKNRSQYYFNHGKYYHSLNPNWEKYGVLEEKFSIFKPETKELWQHINSCKMNLLMMNFENIDFTNPKLSLRKFLERFSSCKAQYNVLIVRDIFNYIASKIKMGRYFYPKENLACWKVHAREYLGITNKLPNKICIGYNRWVTDLAYRQYLAEVLGVDSFIPSWQKVSSFGGGSSFDTLQFQNEASKMNVLKRWETLVADDSYKAFFKDKELVDLSERIFGHIPGTERLIN